MKKLFGFTMITAVIMVTLVIVNAFSTDYKIVSIKKHSLKDSTPCYECRVKSLTSFLSEATDYKENPVTGYYYKAVGVFEVVIVAESVFTTRTSVVVVHSGDNLFTEVGVAFFQKKLHPLNDICVGNTFDTKLLSTEVKFFGR